MSIGGIRAGLKANLSTVSGLRIAETIPDQPNPPMAVIGMPSIQYDTSFGRSAVGTNIYDFPLSVIVGRVSERTAQTRLDTYASTGVGSIKAAIESDRSLGGSAYDVRVREMTGVTSAIIGDVTYLIADFSVQVFSN